MQKTRERLVEAIEHENSGEKSWKWCYNQYVSGVGYTIINRLAAFRCMEVRGFLDLPVTQIGESGLTPAAEKVLSESFTVGREESLVVAYHDACEKMQDEIEILFNLRSTHSVIDPKPAHFRKLVEMIDDISDEIWLADDVLGWVYEYYNRPVVEALDSKDTLKAEDVGPANQFYTPHWVVRLLADNSLGKLYIESTGQQSIIPSPESLSRDERKNRIVSPEDAPGVPELCTYMIPDEGNLEAPSFDDPSEIRVLDPACGSGHFLLYAFDVLERIWWAERPNLSRSEIPSKILEHNLYGVDIDLRSCQLSAFNLYLKARTRAEEENVENFEMPNTNIVCADARVADVEEAIDILNQITGEGTRAREAIDEIIAEFQSTEALGSLLDVQGMLSEELMQEQTDLLRWNDDGPHTLNAFLKKLREAVGDRTSDSFSEQNLKSFLNLLVVLTQDYDVALMNPPYGMRGRMPDDVKKYVEEHYQYYPEYYINFFEVCENLTKTHGRVGMLIPWSFMFRKVFESFRTDFVSKDRRFDFLAEFGYDILDNATVGTVGTVVRTGTVGDGEGTFIRLHDVPKAEKEFKFINAAFDDEYDGMVQRRYTRDTSEFSLIPGAPISYWVPKNLRDIYASNTVLDADNADLPERDSIGVVKQGLATGNDSRFFRYFWEVADEESKFPPISKGGSDAWLLPELAGPYFGKTMEKKSNDTTGLGHKILNIISMKV
ncbi:BREX-5 system adenine-specific DNA-methyltransferase PglX [Haladaptatus sp. GCM10025707]|uniref:BREX-5 system adenine-specific DNA-methyltransferase PglX n=1 Tax=Haladaptatus sp. GCM10025707 TaxID=3252658 RepID=UPI0036160BDD